MAVSNKLVAFAACCAMTVVSIADARAEAGRPYWWPLFPFFAPVSYVCPVHRNAFGDLIDCRGWRFRKTAYGWDNGCFYLDYLPSQFACGARN